MTPAPITWTRFALKSLPFPSDFRRSWRKKIRMRLRAVSPSRSPMTDAGSSGRGAKGSPSYLRQQLEDRVRRGVVIRRSPGGDLPSRHPGDERPQRRRIHQCLHERQPSRPRRFEHDHTRGVLLNARRHRLVHQTQTLRAARIHGAPCKQHVQRGSGADKARAGA